MWDPTTQDEYANDEELHRINRELETELEEKEMYLLELKKSHLRQPAAFVPTRTNLINKEANSLGDIQLQANRNKANDKLSCYLKYCGMVVKEYSESNCAVAFSISVGGVPVAQYAIRLNIIPGTDEWQLKEYHLPIGFMPDIISKKSDVMSKEYFHQMHQALTAYHDRLSQISELKKVLPSHVLLFHSADGSLIELNLQIHQNNEYAVKVLCVLRYDKFQNRPKTIDASKLGISSLGDIDNLKAQLKPFYVNKLQEAFGLALQNKDNEYYCPSDDGLENFENANLRKNKSTRKEISKRNSGNDENDEERTIVSSNFTNVDNRMLQYIKHPREREPILEKNKTSNIRGRRPLQKSVENELDTSTCSKYTSVGRFNPETRPKIQRKRTRNPNTKGRNVSAEDSE